jgi:hypothetical protein
MQKSTTFTTIFRVKKCYFHYDFACKKVPLSLRYAKNPIIDFLISELDVEAIKKRVSGAICRWMTFLITELLMLTFTKLQKMFQFCSLPKALMVQ